MKQKILLVLVIGLLSVSAATRAGEPWRGAIPPLALESEKWLKLLEAFGEEKMPYGSLAGAGRMLTFFSDLPTKEVAYQTVIRLIDDGYPFSTRSYFVTGDIEPGEGTNFVNSYNLYKGLIAKDKGMSRWAEHYFGNVDTENFPKFLFHSALEAYAKRDLVQTEKSLKKILEMNLGVEEASLVKKVARTQARIYFEQEQYLEAFDIYDSFLLRTSAVTPSDWLEAAWSLYFLKRYDQALGFLYNLEAGSAQETVNLEKYVIRALSYQGVCDNERMTALIATFERDYGPTIRAIKSGESLLNLPKLKAIVHPGNAEFYQAQTSIQKLQEESTHITSLPADLRELAAYLYRTEIVMLKRKAASYTEQALSQVAAHLVQLSESLRFLKFDVSRERFNPDSVFKNVETKKRDNVKEAGFEVRWLQMGDYWRDERPDYRAILKNRCGGNEK